jgi:hypothetical protein
MVAANSAPAVLAVAFALPFILSSAGCLQPRSTVCRNGRICGPGSSCDALSRCVESGQDAPCVGLSEGSACKFRDIPGSCQIGICVLYICGDGVVNGTESCEGADLGGASCEDLGYHSATGLACKSDCTFDLSGCIGRCGDGAIDGPEQCDGAQLGGADCRSEGFYYGSGLACLPSCTFDVAGCTGYCGDAATNGPETCDGAPPSQRTCLDYGFERGLLGCSALCGPDTGGCANLGWNLAPSPLPSNVTLRALWGSGPDDVFAVGANTILHWDGAAWNPMSFNHGEPVILGGIWGSSTSDVFAVGGYEALVPPLMGAAVFHWDGTSWSQMVLDPQDTTVPFTSVWGSGPHDVFVGGGARVIQWDGSGWTRTTPTPSNVRALWGSGPGDVFAAGGLGTDGNGAISHFDGARWSDVLSSANGEFTGIGGTGRNDVFAVGSRPRAAGSSFVMRWDGHAWSLLPLPASADLWAVWGNGPGNTFVVGNAGVIEHWDGSRWTDVRLKTAAAFLGIWGTPGDAFAVGSLGTIARWGGETWTPLSSERTPMRLSVAWASGPDDVFAIEETGASGAPGSITSQLVHWDGATWTSVALGGAQGVHAAWGSGPSDVFAVGEGGMIQHWNGSNWSAMSSGTSTALTAVWGGGPGDVFAISEVGLVLHSDGSNWRPISSPWLLGVESAWGSGPDDVFAVSNASVVYHWDGGTWSEASLPSGLWKSVWGSSHSDVYVVGSGDAIAHWDGSSWRAMPLPGEHNLQTVSGSGSGDVFAGGETEHALFHLRVGSWELIALPAGLSPHGLWVTPRQVFVGSDAGANRLDRASISCLGPERDCGNGWDDDCDGLADAADPDCAGKVTELCANSADDDSDGLADCADPDCAAFPGCRPRP